MVKMCGAKEDGKLHCVCEARRTFGQDKTAKFVLALMKNDCVVAEHFGPSIRAGQSTRISSESVIFLFPVALRVQGHHHAKSETV